MAYKHLLTTYATNRMSQNLFDTKEAAVAAGVASGNPYVVSYGGRTVAANYERKMREIVSGSKEHLDWLSAFCGL